MAPLVHETLQQRDRKSPLWLRRLFIQPKLQAPTELPLAATEKTPKVGVTA